MCLGCREILSDPVWACPSSGPIPVGTARSQAVREARPEQADRSDYRRRKRKQGLQSASAPRRADSTRSSGHCQAHQSGRIGLAFNAAHRRDQPVSVNKRSAVGSQLSHLAVEFSVAHWSARRAAAVPDMLALLVPSARGSVTVADSTSAP